MIGLLVGGAVAGGVAVAVYVARALATPPWAPHRDMTKDPLPTEVERGSRRSE